MSCFGHAHHVSLNFPSTFHRRWWWWGGGVGSRNWPPGNSFPNASVLDSVILAKLLAFLQFSPLHRFPGRSISWPTLRGGPSGGGAAAGPAPGRQLSWKGARAVLSPFVWRRRAGSTHGHRLGAGICSPMRTLCSATRSLHVPTWAAGWQCWCRGLRT